MLVKLTHRKRSAHHVQSLGPFAVWILALGFSFITFNADFLLLRGALKTVLAQSYPSTPGEITHSELVEEGGGKHHSVRANIQFRYSVAEQERTGSRVLFHGTLAGGAAPKIVNDYPAGCKVDVFYNPSDPDDAALDRSIDGTLLFGALGLMPFNLIALGLLRWSIIRTLGLRSLPLRREGSRWLLLATNGQPFVVAMVILMFLNLASMFWIHLGKQSDDLSTLVVTWTGLFGVTGFAYWHTQSLVRQEPPSLTLDDDTATITWPASTNVSELSVPRSQLVGVEIADTPVSGNSMVPQTSFAVAMLFGDKTEPSKRLVCTTHSGLEAAYVADWLEDWAGLSTGSAG